ncbi:DUF3892 domain-containing protein [Mammaliicoccus sciuri]|uniref:DUF3892 domain-containing protein n=1 Tax=Mammaliicoccus sciuri TaxID=1296 RepID=UPI001E64AD60|nr:DUF3892 domain-containing protein [Mammaliicoccus sciuri]MCD8898378.1 DUF3892 domain-containing protein [Mammaliicoccus sciuri]
MKYRITHIRLSDSFGSNTEKITHVKIANTTIESVKDMVNYLDKGIKYFYTKSNGSEAEVESVHPSDREPYIRTKGNNSISDNLLNLPKFS